MICCGARLCQLRPPTHVGHKRGSFSKLCVGSGLLSISGGFDHDHISGDELAPAEDTSQTTRMGKPRVLDVNCTTIQCRKQG